MSGEPARRSFLAGLFSDSAVYAVGSSFTVLVVLLLVPVYTRALTLAEFGALGLLELAARSTTALLDVFTLALLAEHAKAEGDEQRRVVGSAIAGTAVLVTVVCGAALLVREPFAQLLLGAGGAAPLVACAVIAAGLEALISIGVAVLRAERRPAALSAVMVSQGALVGAASVGLVVGARWGLAGAIAGRALGDLLALAPLAFALRGRVGRPDPARVRAMAAYGLPTVPVGVAELLMAMSGRWLLGRLATLEAVGLFTAASKIASILNVMVTQPVGMAWGGLVFRAAREPDAARTVRRMGAAVVLLSAAAGTVVIALGAEALGLIAGPAYRAGAGVLGWLAAGQALMVWRQPTSASLLVAGRTPSLGAVYATGAVVAIATSALAIPSRGLVGAGIGAVAAQAWVVCWCALLGARTPLQAAPADASWLPARALAGAAGALAVALAVADSALPVRLLCGLGATALAALLARADLTGGAR